MLVCKPPGDFLRPVSRKSDLLYLPANRLHQEFCQPLGDLLACERARIQTDSQVRPVRRSAELPGSAGQHLSQTGDAALRVAHFQKRCRSETVQAADLDLERPHGAAFQNLDLRSQLRLREIVFISGRIHQKAAYEQSDVRLALVGFQQIAVEMLPGGLEFVPNGFVFQGQNPNGVSFPSVVPFGKVPDFSGDRDGHLVEHETILASWFIRKPRHRFRL
jgi:hypothetical protein